MTYKVEILQGGRITLPIKLRKAWNVDVGDSLLLEQSEGKWRIKTTEDAIKEAQQTVQKYLNNNEVSSREELADMRNNEAQQQEN